MTILLGSHARADFFGQTPGDYIITLQYVNIRPLLNNLTARCISLWVPPRSRISTGIFQSSMLPERCYSLGKGRCGKLGELSQIGRNGASRGLKRRGPASGLRRDAGESSPDEEAGQQTRTCGNTAPAVKYFVTVAIRQSQWEIALISSAPCVTMATAYAPAAAPVSTIWYRLLMHREFRAGRHAA